MFSMCTRNGREPLALGRAMQTGSTKRSGAAGVRGFTLIELMIVVAIIMILIGIAAGMYTRSVHKAREATLRSDLSVMRQAIDHYTLDKEAAPQALEDLVNPQSQYLREFLTDRSSSGNDWHVDFGHS